MKNIIIRSIKYLTVAIMLSIFTSCEYQKIADADYPEQLIYMPAARNGIFNINTVAIPIGAVPTPGNPYRYKVNIDANEFIVPLAAYRSGIDNNGSFAIDITLNTDTITSLKDAGMLTPATKILTSDKFTIAESASMADGEELAKFDLIVRLDSMLSNYSSNTVFALGVSISSEARKTNPLYATTIVAIDTRMMKPTANFTTTRNGLQVTFNNTSLMSVGYAWDFGDGSGASTEKSPVHTYPSGTYTTTLTALGITGEPDKSVITATVVIP